MRKVPGRLETEGQSYHFTGFRFPEPQVYFTKV